MKSSIKSKDKEVKMEIEYGYCHCGCGRKTDLWGSSDANRGRVRGEPCKYCIGHHPRNYKPLGSTSISRGRTQIKTKMGWKPLSRYRAEKKIGRILKKGEVVHHIDSDRSNDDPSNIQICFRSEHRSIHAKLRKQQWLESIKEESR